MSYLWNIGRSTRLGHYSSKLVSGQPFDFPGLSLLGSMKLASPTCARSLVGRPMRLEFWELLPTHGLVASFPLVHLNH